MSLQPNAGPFEIYGISPKTVEEFEERLPKVEEGDYLIGGRLREDFKPFVYSGLISEFPINGETAFIVTERGENVSQGYDSPEEIVKKQPTIEKSEAYKVLNAETESENQALIIEELLSQHRAEREQSIKQKDQPAWQKYHSLGIEILEPWEQAYNHMTAADHKALTEYANLLEQNIGQLNENLFHLAEEKEGQQIETVRNNIYELEHLTKNIR